MYTGYSAARSIIGQSMVGEIPPVGKWNDTGSSTRTRGYPVGQRGCQGVCTSMQSEAPERTWALEGYRLSTLTIINSVILY